MGSSEFGTVHDVALRFLRGDTSVPAFAVEFRAAIDDVTQRRPLRGTEIDLFDTLRHWGDADPDECPALVERLRTQARDMADR